MKRLEEKVINLLRRVPQVTLASRLANKPKTGITPPASRLTLSRSKVFQQALRATSLGAKLQETKTPGSAVPVANVKGGFSLFLGLLLLAFLYILMTQKALLFRFLAGLQSFLFPFTLFFLRGGGRLSNRIRRRGKGK